MEKISYHFLVFPHKRETFSFIYLLQLATVRVRNFCLFPNSNISTLSIFRKMFVKRQKILHNYGSVDDELQEEEVLAEVERRINHSTHTQPQIGLEAVEPPPGAEVTVGRSRCKCGSYEHQRTSHKSCRFNKKNKQKELEQQD